MTGENIAILILGSLFMFYVFVFIPYSFYANDRKRQMRAGDWDPNDPSNETIFKFLDPIVFKKELELYSQQP